MISRLFTDAAQNVRRFRIGRSSRDNQGGLHMAKNGKGQAKKPKQEKPKIEAAAQGLRGFAPTPLGAGAKK